MLIRQLGGYPTSLGTHNESFFYKEWLIHFLEGPLILSYCSGDSVGSDRTALKCTDNCTQYLVVYGVQTAGIYIELVESETGNLQIYVTVTHYLCKIPYTLEQSVYDSRGTATTEGYLLGSLIVYTYFKNSCTTLDYLDKLFCIIVFESAVNPEALTQWSREKSCTRGSPDKCKRIK